MRFLEKVKTTGLLNLDDVLGKDGSLIEGVTFDHLQQFVEACTNDAGYINIHEQLEFSEDVSVVYNEKHYPSKKIKEGDGETPAPEVDLPSDVLMRITYNCAQRDDMMNRNRRIYVASDMPGAVQEANDRAQQGSVFILGGHPKQQTPSRASDVAALGRRVTHDETTGKVGLVIDILDSNEGRSAATIWRAKGALPISSRATGKLEIVKEYKGRFGEYKVDEADSKAPIFLLRNYRFIGWDFVPGIQSVHGAIERPHDLNHARLELESTESNEPTNVEEKDMKLDLKTLKSDHAAVYDEAKNEILEEQKTVQDTAKETSDAKYATLETTHNGIVTERDTIQTENDTLKLQVEEFEAQLTNDEDQIVEDPELVKLREEVAQMKASTHQHNMSKYAESLFAANGEHAAYKGFKDLLMPTIISNDYVPANEADAQKYANLAVNFTKAILACARKLGSAAAPTASKGAAAPEVQESHITPMFTESITDMDTNESWLD